MGGCFSGRAADPSKGKPAAPAVRRFGSSREPPPEPDAPQEETVKEVLSETPARAREEGRPKKDAGAEKRDAAGRSPVSGFDERSELSSEICSLSESLSVSTTVTEKRGAGDGDAVREPPPVKFRRKRSVSGELAGKRDRSVGVGCGSGRSSPSPVRRDGAVGRTYSAREAAKSRAQPAPPAGIGPRRDPGERSGRRSVSPVVKRAADQRPGAVQRRSLSAPRIIGNGRASPRRIPAGQPDSSGGGGGGGGRNRVQDAGYSGGGGGPSEGKESLENPLVSLECFIFL